MKHPFLKRSICLLLAVLSVLAMPAYALEGVAQAEEAQSDGQKTVQSDPFDPSGEATEKETPNVPEVEVPTVFVNEDGSYRAPEDIAVYVMRHMQETSLSNPSQADERYTGVVAFYDYAEGNEKTRLEHPYFFYYEKGELQDKDPAFYLAKGYLDLTEAPVADSSINPAAGEEEDRLVYVAEERYVDENAEEHPAYLFAFHQEEGENGLFTGDYEETAYVDGLAVTAEGPGAAEPVQPETVQETQAAESIDPAGPAKAPAADPEDPSDPSDPTDPEPQGPTVVHTVPTVTVKTVSAGIQIAWGADEYATGFRVYRKNGNGDWGRIADLTDGNAVSYVDTRAPSNANLSYTVRAYYGDTANISNNPYGSGDWSGFAGTGPLYYLAAPVPSAFGAASKITVSWKAVAGADYYIVYRTESDGSWKRVAMVTADKLSYVDTTAVSGSSYYYTLRAYNKARDAWSLFYDTRQDSINRVSLHATPVVKLIPTTTGINVTWNKDAAATGYRIYRSLSDGTTIVLANITSGNTTSYMDTKVTNGQSYSYGVRAYYGDVTKLSTATVASAAAMWSDVIAVRTIFMKTPQFTTTYSDNAGMVVQWTAVAGATGYLLYRRSSTTENWAWLAFVTNGTTYQDKSVTNGKPYYYAIRAYKTDAKGTKYFSVDTDQTTATVYHATVNTTVAAVPAGLRISWNLDSRAVGYRVYRLHGNDAKVVANISASSLKAGQTLAYVDDPATDLKAGDTYYYTVRAYYGTGSINVVRADVRTDWNGFVWKAAVYMATPHMAEFATNEPTGIKVKWNTVAGAAGYYIYRRTATGNWHGVGSVQGGTTNAYIDTTATKLPAGTVCYYTVRAFSAKGVSISYFEPTGSYALYLPKPGGVKVAPATSRGTTVTWNSVKGATSYTVFRHPQGGGSWTQLGTVTGTSYVDASANKTTDRYIYTIRPSAAVTVNGKKVTIVGDYDRTGYQSGITWSGEERNDWVKKNENTYYVDKNGFLLTGWQYLKRNGRQYKYYFDEETGALVTNLYSYFGKEYRSMKCRIEVYINAKSSSNPSFMTIYVYDGATDSYCIPTVSVRCIGSPVNSIATNSGYLGRGGGSRWASHMEGLQYATYIHGTPSYFHSVMFRSNSNHALAYSTYNSLANNRNNSNGCIRMQCIYAYLIQDITHNGYGLHNRVPVRIYKNGSQPGPFGVPKMDKISSRSTEPTDPSITGKFFYSTSTVGVKVTGGAPAWTYY